MIHPVSAKNKEFFSEICIFASLIAARHGYAKENRQAIFKIRIESVETTLILYSLYIFTPFLHFIAYFYAISCITSFDMMQAYYCILKYDTALR